MATTPTTEIDPVTRLFLLLSVVGVLFFQQMPDAVSIRASLCADKSCVKRQAVGFEPARINLQVRVPLDSRNRMAIYGVVCDEVEITRSRADLNGKNDAPVFISETANVAAGECYGVVKVWRSDGTTEQARSGNLLIMERS